MSLTRWTGTTVAMCAAGWALWLLGPEPSAVQAAVGDPQGLVDEAGVDALLLVVVPVLAWLCWAWGALGLLLTAATALPGWTGRLAGTLLTGLLPAGARRAAAVALGLGLTTVAPAALVPAVPATTVVTASAADELGGVADRVPVDWPTAPTTPTTPTTPTDEDVPDPPGGPEVADWPGPPADAHVVLRGECLWGIAADWLRLRAAGSAVDDAEVQRAVQAWWRANEAVIGPDPDLLLPGQVLRPPN